MNTERLKALLGLFTVLAVPILAFSIWTWAWEPRNSEVVRRVALTALPTIFVLGHLALILLGLTSRAKGGVRVLSKIFLSLDTLLVAFLGIGLLLSTAEADMDSKLLGGMCIVLLLPIIVLGSGLLLVYVKRLRMV